MGYYLITEPEKPMTRERVEYLMRRAGEKFHAEFPSHVKDIVMELDDNLKIVKASCGEDARIYLFEELGRTK